MATVIDRPAEGTDEVDMLVERARRRDPAAFETLYLEHHGHVFALALRLTRDASGAEELTQDAFVQAWRALPGFRAESRFGTWIHSITVRAYLQRKRSRTRWEDRVSDVDLETFGFASRRAMPGTDVDLERAIAVLPNGAREVLLLHDVYGYKHREIGSMLGIAEGTAKAQLHRARRLLREALA
jgi:RNA polymerase sigma-70 factor (ECF subfamily)